MTLPTSQQLPSIQRAVWGLVIGLLGILAGVFGWHLTANWQIPYLGFAFVLFGGLITVRTWARSIRQLMQLAGQQQYAEAEFAAFDVPPQAMSPARNVCSHCQSNWQPEYRYCPMCGTKL